jgi:glyoxylase-like metal-dependent hydrolase (beta-lactamase superfamily II)
MKEPATRSHRKPATSKHFTLEEIAPGVWAAIHKPGGWAIGNAGLVDLGDLVLIFDTFMTPQAASDLREAALALTGKPPHTVILSHPHNDHIWGSRVFLPHADMISTVSTQQWIALHGRAEIDSYREILPGRLRELESAARKAKGGGDAGEIKPGGIHPDNLATWLDYYRGIAAALPLLEVFQPNITFDKELDLHGQAGNARLLSFTGGHTLSDTILFLPEQGVVFMGDLLFIGCHPYLGDGEPARIHPIMKEILALGAKVFVPGHGPVGTKADIDKQIKYVDKVMELARRAADQGYSPEKLAKTAIPKAYADWDHTEFFAKNLQACYDKVRVVPPET